VSPASNKEVPVTARRSALIAGSALALFALVAAAVPGVIAQDATPVAEEGAVARPVHIHSGSCAELGDVVAPLSDLTAPVGEGAGLADSAFQAESSVTNVPMTLDAILAAPHAINAHLSAEEIGTYIACGDIGGAIEANGAVVIGLAEDSDSGYTGIAYLASGADGASTDVSVFIAPVIGAAG
jgi:hypothetical protein